jgi:hypothetical protein
MKIYHIILSAFILAAVKGCGQQGKHKVKKTKPDTNIYYELFDFKNFKGVETLNKTGKSKPKYLVENNKVKYIAEDSTVIEFSRYAPREELWDLGYKIKIIDSQHKYRVPVNAKGENEIRGRLYLKDNHLFFVNEIASIYGDNIVVLDTLLNPLFFTRPYGKRVHQRPYLIQYVGGFEQGKIYLIDSTKQTFNYTDSSINNLIGKYSNSPKLDYNEPIRTNDFFYDLPYWLNFDFYGFVTIEGKIDVEAY